MMWTTSDGGAKWHSLPDSCYQPAQATDLAGLASPGGNVVFELCAGDPGAGSEGKSLSDLEQQRVDVTPREPSAPGWARPENCGYGSQTSVRDGGVRRQRRVQLANGGRTWSSPDFRRWGRRAQRILVHDAIFRGGY